MAVASARGTFQAQEGGRVSAETRKQPGFQSPAPTSGQVTQIPLNDGNSSDGAGDSESQPGSVRAIRFSEKVDVVTLETPPDSPAQDSRDSSGHPEEALIAVSEDPRGALEDGRSRQLAALQPRCEYCPLSHVVIRLACHIVISVSCKFSYLNCYPISLSIFLITYNHYICSSAKASIKCMALTTSK